MDKNNYIKACELARDAFAEAFARGAMVGHGNAIRMVHGGAPMDQAMFDDVRDTWWAQSEVAKKLEEL